MWGGWELGWVGGACVCICTFAVGGYVCGLNNRQLMQMNSCDQLKGQATVSCRVLMCCSTSVLPKTNKARRAIRG